MSRRNSDGMVRASGTIATRANDNAVVHRAGAETVGRTKTFDASPVVPAPTADDDATTKSYVNVAVSGGTPGAAPGGEGKHQPAGDLDVTGCAPTVLATRLEPW